MTKIPPEKGIYIPENWIKRLEIYKEQVNQSQGTARETAIAALFGYLDSLEYLSSLSKLKIK